MTRTSAALPWIGAVAGALMLASTAGAVAAQAKEFEGKVIAVIDGDTILVRDDNGRRRDIRIAGIDAPEIKQAYGTRARRHLVELAYGRRVVVSWYKLDRYRRMIGHVRVMPPQNCRASDCQWPIDVALAQIEAGLAWHDKEHLIEQSVEEQLRYAHAEREARLRRLGLWTQIRPLPPWQYRHRYANDLPRLAPRR